jgi:hypothetical protein
MNVIIPGLETPVLELEDGKRHVLVIEGDGVDIITSEMSEPISVTAMEDTLSGWEAAIDALKTALAEAIVQRGEKQLEKEALYAACYGNREVLMDIVNGKAYEECFEKAHGCCGDHPFSVAGAMTGRMVSVEPFFPSPLRNLRASLRKCRKEAEEGTEALAAVKATLTTKVLHGKVELAEAVEEDPCPACEKPGIPGQPACTDCHGFEVKQPTLEDYLRHAQEALDMAGKADQEGAVENARKWREVADERMRDYRRVKAEEDADYHNES